MTEGETDVGNQSLGLHQAAIDGIHTKVLFIIYGMKGNDASLCKKGFKNRCYVLNVFTSFYCTILHLIAMPTLHLVSLHLSSLQMSCHVMSCQV